MLSLGKLAPGGQQYYLDTVANGVEDYYTGAGEAPGEWTGHGADRLGLDGQVEADGLHAVLDRISRHHPTRESPVQRHIPTPSGTHHHGLEGAFVTDGPSDPSGSDEIFRFPTTLVSSA